MQWTETTSRDQVWWDRTTSRVNAISLFGCQNDCVCVRASPRLKNSQIMKTSCKPMWSSSDHGNVSVPMRGSLWVRHVVVDG